MLYWKIYSYKRFLPAILSSFVGSEVLVPGRQQRPRRFDSCVLAFCNFVYFLFILFVSFQSFFLNILLLGLELVFGPGLEKQKKKEICVIYQPGGPYWKRDVFETETKYFLVRTDLNGK